MELSYLLALQILKLFIIIFIGYILVKSKVMKTEDSKIFSTFVLYVAAPCAIINSFQIECTSDKLWGLLAAFIGAIIVHIVYIPLTNLLAKIFGFTPIEKASIIYSNSGNLIIPLVGSLLGQEWILYTSGYMVIQTILLWTHAKSLVINSKEFDIKKIVCNINIIAIVIGIVLFFTGIRLPSVVGECVKDIGGTIGTLSMLVIGMLIANMEFKEIFIQKRTYLICFFRLIVYPVIIIALFKILPLQMISADASQIFLITVLAASAPAASTITQFAQLYNKHPGYASVINILSVLMCIVTMPIMVIIYQSL